MLAHSALLTSRGFLCPSALTDQPDDEAVFDTINYPNSWGKNEVHFYLELYRTVEVDILSFSS